MSFVENIVQAVLAKFKTQERKVKAVPLSSDWKSGEKCLDEFLKESVLLGLSEPNGIAGEYGNVLLFSNPRSSEEIASQLEVGGKWIWISSSISSLVVKDDEIFAAQEHSELVKQTSLHIGKTVVAYKIWQPLPHLAIEFSDGSVLAIHGNNEQYESWAFDNLSPSIGVYALPGGPIAVG